jgi:hypothetical protein
MSFVRSKLVNKSIFAFCAQELRASRLQSRETVVLDYGNRQVGIKIQTREARDTSSSRDPEGKGD